MSLFLSNSFFFHLQHISLWFRAITQQLFSWLHRRNRDRLRRRRRRSRLLGILPL